MEDLLGFSWGFSWDLVCPIAKSTVILAQLWDDLSSTHTWKIRNHGTPPETIDTQCFAGIHDIVSLLQEIRIVELFQLMLGDIEAMYLSI